jgi:DNA-binding CsgD family transcriptional regulator
MPSVPDSTRARLHAVASHALLYLDDTSGADDAGAQAQRLGAAAGEYSASVWGGAARSIVARAEGRLGDALAHALAAAETADRAGQEARQRHPGIWLGGALAALDRFSEAELAYVTGRRDAERLGTAWSQPLWHFLQASLRTWQGRLDEAVAEAEAGLRIADQLTARQMSVPLLGLLTRVAVLRAEMPLARKHLWRMNRLLAEGITAAPEDVTWTIAMYQEAEKQPEVALATLADVYRRLPVRSFLLSNDPGAAAHLVRIALKASAPELAEATVTAAKKLATRNPSAVSIAAAAAHSEGLLRGDRALLLDAVEAFRESPRPLARASAMEDAAAAELAAGRRAEAVELLETALGECTAAGARRSTQRLERRLRALGVRRRAATRADSPTTSVARLTPSEQRVADLVAEGLTNRQVAERLYISPHTVDSHLRHIFDKLGVKSRVDLTRVITRTVDPR